MPWKKAKRDSNGPEIDYKRNKQIYCLRNEQKDKLKNNKTAYMQKQLKSHMHKHASLLNSGAHKTLKLRTELPN